MRSMVLAVALLMMAGCGRMGSSQSESTKADAGEEAAADCGATESLEVSATDTTFDKACLSGPAGEPFKVTFENKDAFGHSFSVYEKEGGEELSRGEIFSGPKKVETEIPALEAGSYHFQCDVHPFVMQGVLKVG